MTEATDREYAEFLHQRAPYGFDPQGLSSDEREAEEDRRHELYVERRLESPWFYRGLDPELV